MRIALMAVLLFGLVGTEVELLLLKHTDGFWQMVPVVLLGVGILAAIWCAAAPGRASLHSLRVVMAVYLVGGMVGTVQHFIGNIGYARDSNPSLAGADLFREAVMGSTPMLAPGTMIQLAIIGLLFTFRHPALRAGGRSQISAPRTTD